MTRYARSSWNQRALGFVLILLAAATAEPTTTPSTPSSTAVPSTTAAPVHTSQVPASAPITVATTSPQTCRSATVNYITHRLPQQCWTGSTSTASSSATGGNASGSINFVSAANNLSTIANVPSVNSEQHEDPRRAESPSRASENEIAQHSKEAASSPAAASETTPSSVAADNSEQIEAEADSPLDNAEFLSFEEWAKRKLAAAGEGADALAQERKSFTQDRQRPGANNALDTLGEDSEIAFDFNPFGGPNERGNQPLEAASGSPTTARNNASPAPDAPRKRSKDAGKTCKERSNYASFDCAANVLKTNPKCKSSSSILVENKDSYMLNECSTDNKFLIVELCETVLIDTIVLANFEFFSSMFRTFRISGSSHYPPKPDQWQHLGTFEARNSREIQAFLVENPIYSRYLRVEFLDHYGSEYYCPVSLLRVHGMTMYEEFLHYQQGNEQGDDEEETNNSAVVSADIKDTVTVVSGDKGMSTVPSKEVDHDTKESPGTASPASSTVSSPTPAEQPVSENNAPSVTAATNICLSTTREVPEPVTFVTPDKCAVEASPPAPRTKIDVVTTHATSTPDVKSTRNSTDASPSSASQTSTSISSSKISSKSSSDAIATISRNTTEEVVATTKKSEGQSAPSGANSTTLTAIPHTVHTAPPAPPAYQPPTQESFFKSIHKRLQALEANATLSLQYIESQSALLRDAFAKVEKRQIGKTSTFLETLNKTVTHELARFKGDYDQLWQSAVMELASQREEGRKERELLGERIKVLAEEMVNQKRLMAAQATLLLLCLGLVVFGKLGGVAPTVDSGLLQGMQEIVMKAKQAKLQKTGKSMLNSNWESPWPSPSMKQQESPGSGQHQDRELDLRERISQNGGLGLEKVISANNEGRTSSLLPRDSRNGEILSVRSAPTTPGS